MFSALILAAGKSQRMGSPKPLLRLGDKSFLDLAIDNCMAAGIKDVVVVLGAEADRIIGECSLERVQVVVNQQYELGQSSSVQAGVKMLAGTTKAFLLYPVDFAMTSQADIKALLYAWKKYPEAVIIAPEYQGDRGHPVLLDSCLKAEILALSADQGVNQVTRRYYDRTRLVAVANSWISQDIDTIEHYEQAVQAYNAIHDQRKQKINRR